MLQYTALIALLSFSLSGDSLFNVAIIWRVLAQGGSAKTLGLFLCLIMLVTFLLQEFSKKLKGMLQQNPSKSFTYIRMIGLVCSLAFIPLLWSEDVGMLYLAGLVFTVLSFFTQVTVEAIMGQEVLQGRLSSNVASRILQTAIQIAAFLGASIAGFTLGLGNMKGVLIVNAATYASGALFYPLLSRRTKARANLARGNTPFQPEVRRTKLFLIWISFVGLLLLTIQISAFNFYIPIISQQEKAWTATQFGYIDAAAGLGGFLCTFVISERGLGSKIWIFAFAAILLSDAFFYYLNNAYYVAMVAFGLGFFVNAFRVKLREFVYEAVSSAQEIVTWTGRLTAMSMLIRALTPLFLAFLVIHPSFNLMICGAVIAATIVLLELTYYFGSFLKYKNKRAESEISPIPIA